MATQNKFTNKVGSYAISTLDDNMWLPIESTRPKVTKEKAAIHPIFLECVQFTNDPFWRDKFILASNNKLPKGFNYSNGILSYQKTTTIFSIVLPQNPIETANVFIDFLRSKGNIYSVKDQEYSALIYNTTAYELPPITWKDSKSALKECLLIKYISTMRDNMNLTTDEVKDLNYVIRSNISSKIFNKDNIIISGNCIHSITGLLYNPDTHRFYVDPSIKNVKVPRKVKEDKDCKDGDKQKVEKDTIPKYEKNWDKYTSLILKNAGKYDHNNNTSIVHVNTATHTVTNTTNSMTLTFDM